MIAPFLKVLVHVETRAGRRENDLPGFGQTAGGENRLLHILDPINRELGASADGRLDRRSGISPIRIAALTVSAATGPRGS